MARTTVSRRTLKGGAALVAASAIFLSSAAVAAADTVVDGPVDLGSAEAFAVLGAVGVSNSGPSVLNGDVGISPNNASSVTGLDGGQGSVINGDEYYGEEVAALARQDAAIAYGVADSLTPQSLDITQLDGLTLSPGTYTGGAVDLAVNGALAFEGSDRSVWVMQVQSALTINANTEMTFSGGASACNVFWQVGTSATLGESADFAGTIVAQESISLVAAATVQGRLLALTGAVTLDTNTITVPAECPTTGTVVETTVPSITSSAPPDGTVGTSYEFTVVADGTPAPTYTVEGSLPPGLAIDEVTGVISGTPTTPGDFTFTVIADNPDSEDDSATYTVTIADAPPVASPPVTPPEESAPPTGPGPSAPAPSAPAPSVPGGGGGGSGGGGGGDSSTGGGLPVTGGAPLAGLAIAGLALLVGALALIVGVPRAGIRFGRTGR